MRKTLFLNETKKIYLKYFFKYLSGMLAILMPCLFVIFVSWTTTRNQIVSNGRERFQDGLGNIASEISQMSIWENYIQNSDYFRNLSTIKGNIPYGKYMNLYYAKSEMTNVRYIYKFTPFCFILFKSNDIVVSSYHCDESFSDKYYGNMLTMSMNGNPLSAQEVKKLLTKDISDMYSFVRMDSISYYAQTLQVEHSPILCVINKPLRGKEISKRTYHMGYVISPEKLIEILLTEDCRKDGIVRITDETGNILLNYGNIDTIPESNQDIMDIGSHWILSAREQTETKWLIQVGIPKSAILKQMKNLYRFIYCYVAFSIITAIILAYYFGRKQYLNFKNLYSLIPEQERKSGDFLNEYKYILKIFAQMAKNSEQYLNDKRALELQNQSIRLEKLITEGIHTSEERQELDEAHLISSEFYCVAIVRISLKQQSDYATILLSLKEYLKEKWKEKISHIHTGFYDELFIFSMPSDAEPNVNDVVMIFEKITNVFCTEVNCILNVGISTVGVDLSNLKRCYAQAQQVLEAYYQSEKTSVNHYHIGVNNTRYNILNLDFFNQLHNNIVQMNTTEIQKNFLSVKAYYHKHPVHFEQQKEHCFYTIHNILYNITCLYGIEYDNESLDIKYVKEDNVDLMLNKLSDAALYLTNKILNQKTKKLEQSQSDVFNYMTKNFTEKNLSVNYVCEKLGITERYLQTTIKEKTGDTFAVYLEKLRIMYAAELLIHSDYTNEQIADIAGFSSSATFYRAFNKRMEMSPKAFKEGNET